MLSRRRYLTFTAAAAAVAATPLLRAAGLPAAADDSDLIYLTPLRPDGSESRCQAEVWFVRDSNDLIVVTAADAWRARAVGAGLTRTRIWVGDVGVWDAQARYKALPEVLATARLERDADAHARLLDVFGDKYSLEWMVWGPRFRKGLADGSRVMLRYQLA